MRKFTLFVTSVTIIFMVCVTSCSKDDGSILENESGLILMGGESRLSFVASAPDISKTTTDLLPVNTTMGVHILNTLEGTTTPTNSTLWGNHDRFKNLEYKVNEAGAIVKSVPGDVILVTGFTYDMYAYSPYDASIITEGKIKAIPVNHGVDILWAKTPNQTPTTAIFSSNLVFKHKSAKIAFKLVSAEAGKDVNFDKVDVNVTGFHAAGTMNLLDGNVTVSGGIDTDYDIVFNNVTQSGATYFLPTGSNMSLYIEITIPDPAKPDIPKKYTGTYTYNFVSGEAYTVTIAVNDRSVGLGFTGKVTQWIPVVGNAGVENEEVQ